MRDINSLNKVLLVGHLVKKPEIRYLRESGRPVARFQVATNERLFYPDSGKSSDRTEFHRIVAWGKLAEFCDKFLDQGRQILIEGKLRNRSWEDRDGNKRYATEVEALNIVLLGKKGAPQEEIQASTTAAEASVEEFPEISEPATEEFPKEPGTPDDDEEVPF
jgi:single-strand DNA-binding protein